MRKTQKRRRQIVLGAGAATIAIVAAIFIGRAHENTRTDRLIQTLVQNAQPNANAIDFAPLTELPPPVLRYFKHVLKDGQKVIKTVEMHQSGTLRTAPDTDKWFPFTARQIVAPFATSFIWDAYVQTPLATHLQVLDSYRNGAGSGRITFLSAFPIATETDTPELNAGALHRYLAEAVWYPTALLPQAGVVWTPIDNYTALATLTDNNTTVSLEFRFNASGEVISIYTPGRFGRFDGKYRQLPWEGHFRNYQLHAGIRVPRYGEVGWYVNGKLHIVWKGNLQKVLYTFSN